MHHSFRSVRPAAALALAVGLALVVPGTASAGTTEPTGTTTTTSTPDPTTTTSTPDPTTTTSTPDPTTTTTAPDATTTSSAPPTATTEAATTAASGKRAPFGAGSRLRALVPGDSGDQAAFAGGFIVRTLAARGDHYNFPGSTFFDGGNTVDAVLALDGAGVGLDQADAAADYLAAHVNDYVGYPDPADPSSPETYAGPLGKLVLGVVAHGADPTDFGGQDLVARLEGLMTADGRFSDQSNFGDPSNPTGDYSNTIGQALDVIALGRATGSVPDEAVDYLLAQQCADGSFRGNLDTAGAPCTGDSDATAFAAQALVGLLGADDPDTVRALTWLAGRQAANGGILNQDGQYNANTAGVAAQAFAAGGFATQLGRAQAFLASLQMDCSFATALRGGIAFTAADRTTLAGSPTNTAVIDRALRATPQATLGLAGGSLLDVTGDGAEAGAPTLACPAATTTSSTSATTPTTPAGADAPADPPAASAVPGALAFTGADVAAPAILGLVLLLAGVGAIVLARRRGAHA